VTPPIASGALFGGYGGLDLAVQAVFGAQPAWVSEIDPHASKILAAHYPDAPNLGDITTINWTTTPRVRILTGGFPCQDLSIAGNRAGLRDGTRSGLWYHMARAIQTLRPDLVVIENVRGLLSAPADGYVEPCPWCLGDAGDDQPAMRALGAVLADLAELGYDAAWCGLRAADVGAPHGRYRIFVLAWPQDATPEAGWSDGVGRGADSFLGRRDPDLTLLRTPTAQLAINGGSQHPEKRKAGGHGPTLADEVEHLLPTPAVNDMGAGKTVEAWDAWTERMRQAHGNGNGHGKSLAIEAQRLLPTPQRMDTAGAVADRRSTTGYGPAMRDAAHIDFRAYAPVIDRWQYILGRDAPPPTEPTGKGGAHRLSPRFVEWMMGLDDGWVTGVGLSRDAQLKALGNGVVPQQAVAALRHLMGIRAWALTHHDSEAA
jgi:DNA (cytosine-5)-methyltransferase 1